MSARDLIFKLLRYSGLPALIRHTWQRRRVSIVMFHDIAPDQAERSFAYLAKRYNVIALADYLNARARGDAAALPDRALIITLDDGHRRNRALLPVLQRLQIPVTIFLCSGIVGTNRHYWFKHRHPAISTAALKTVPNLERLTQLARAGFWQEHEFETPQALSAQDIQDMKPFVDFQSHTVFHPCLPQCVDEEARLEIFESKYQLEDRYGLDIQALAFPNGDYSARDIELIKQAGYACSITVDLGFNTLHTDPYRLKRLSIDDTDNLDAVCVKASGLWTWLLAAVGKRRRRRETAVVQNSPQSRKMTNVQ